MLKKVVAVVLIVLAGGTWAYLDYLNKQELQAAEELRKSMEQSRAQARARMEAKAKFETQIAADLTACKASAEQANADFITKNQQPVRRKPGQFTIPPAVADEAAKTLEAANAACQQTYNTRLSSGS
jgi:pantothenate synthetase